MFNLDERIAPNFTLREVIEWPKHQAMNPLDRAKAHEMALKALNQRTYENAKKIAKELQNARTLANARFPEMQGRIGIKCLSWLRALEWELYRRRSGKSQHIHGHAVDYIVTNCGHRTDEVMGWLFREYKDFNGGLARMVRNDKYIFIHLDLGPKRRWEY